jgi:hypothetical protein
LEGGPPMFNPGFTRPGLLKGFAACYRAFTFFGRAFQPVHAACSAFARRYLRSRCCFPFLRVLRCFSSPGSLRTPMHSVHDTPKGGFPHSDILRSQLGYQLPQAFRRFQRPSSPLNAKTSTVCPLWLDHTCQSPKPVTRSLTLPKENLLARSDLTNPQSHQMNTSCSSSRSLLKLQQVRAANLGARVIVDSCHCIS